MATAEQKFTKHDLSVTASKNKAWKKGAFSPLEERERHVKNDLMGVFHET